MFEELGVDHIFIDEAHYFKNLETPTKMERVAGIQTGGSETRLRPVHESAIPHSSTRGMASLLPPARRFPTRWSEMYTMTRFLDPEGLRSRGIDHFDALFRSRNKASYTEWRIMPRPSADGP